MTRSRRTRSRARRGRRRSRRRPATRWSTSWAFDSRALEPGACFVALQGERDGHDFVAAAFAAGARVALVVDDRARARAAAPARAIVQVDDVLARAAGARARDARRASRRCAWSASPARPGKTSTKDLLAAALAPLGCYASPASYNNEFGLPITLLQHARRRERRRHRDGRAVPRRRRGAVRRSRARRSASSPTSGSRTPSTSAARRARPRRWGSCSTRCPPAGSRC